MSVFDHTMRAAAERLRHDFLWFATWSWDIVNPGQDLSATVAFLAVAEALARVERGEVQRLLITVPPRSGKSFLTSVAFPAFALGRDPRRRILCASYSSDLSVKLSRDCRSIMVSDRYGLLFPRSTIAGKNTEAEITTAFGGDRYATSVGGTVTGRGGDFLIIDDPMKPDEAKSLPQRDKVFDWYSKVMVSRLNNKATGAIVVVMQRLDEEDLVGRLLAQGDGIWEHVSVPAICETEQVLDLGAGCRFRRPVGHVLDEAREPRHVLDQLKRDLGSADFSAQYQQDPVPQDGDLVKWAWFKTYDRPPDPATNDILVVSWDTAMCDREVNDYSVGIVARIRPNKEIYILDVIRLRLTYPDLKQRIIAEANNARATVSLIEAAGSGLALVQELPRVIQVIPCRPESQKAVRFSAVTPLIEAGQVYLPRAAPWLDAFRREILSFPNCAHDDQTDALSQLLTWVKQRTTPTVYVGSYGMHCAAPTGW